MSGTYPKSADPKINPKGTLVYPNFHTEMKQKGSCEHS